MASQKLSRRAWTSAAVFAVPVASAAQSAPAAQAAGSPADMLDQARQANQRSREALSRVKVAMSVEPATRFEA